TALHWAAHWGDVATVDLLLRAGASVNSRNAYGVTPLLLASASGSVPVITRLIAAGANPNLAHASGETPLMAAARTGNGDAVKALLAAGADVAAVESAKGQNALMWALAERHLTVVERLIERGASVTAPSKAGFTPLMFAARN